MPICDNCGTDVASNQKFCPNCGNPVKQNSTNNGFSDEVEIIKSDISFLKTLKITWCGLLGIIIFTFIRIRNFDFGDTYWEVRGNQDNYLALVYFFLFLLLILIILLVFILSCTKISMTVTNKRVYGKTTFGRRVDLPLDMISAVGSSAFKGINVATSSGKIKFYCISNHDEIHKAISDLLLERQNITKPTPQIKKETQHSSADEILKFKKLLDAGIITQEEFDAKKKQLLGL